MKKKFLSLFMVIAITIFQFAPTMVSAGSIGQIGSGKRVTFTETDTSSEQVASSTNMEEYIDSKNDAFKEALDNANISVDLNKSNIDPNTLFSSTEPYKYATVNSCNSSYMMIEGNLTQVYTVNYTTVNVTKSSSPSIYIIQFNSNGGSSVNSQSITGNGYKVSRPADPTKDNNNFVGWYSDEGLTNAWNFDTVVTSSMTLYAKWEPISTATTISSAEITLKAPKVGDKVEKITKNDGYGDYETQSANPIVSTTTNGLDIYAYWVSGLEALSEEPFYGTFEKDKYYYAMIDFEAQEGYELPATFPDGIKVNGVAPDEIFAVYGGTYTHCVVKIKATTTVETSTYEYVDNTANQTYTINKDDTLTVRINADYSLFENGGKVYVDGALVDSKNYTSKSGSTIITFTKDYMSSLSEGEHTLKVTFNNGGEATTKFTVAKAEESTNNPQTGDNVMFYISMLGLSIIGLAGAGLYIKKRRFN